MGIFSNRKKNNTDEDAIFRSSGVNDDIDFGSSFGVPASTSNNVIKDNVTSNSGYASPVVLDLDAKIPDGFVEKNKAICNEDITSQAMVDLIYYLRDKNGYKTDRETFFFRGSERVVQIISDRKRKLDSEDFYKIERYVDQMNSTFRVFNINTCLRKVHFLAQSYHETFSFLRTTEIGGGKPSYSGGKFFYGRGMKQITHDYNYLNYYQYQDNSSVKYFDIYMKYRKDYESVLVTIKKSADCRNAGLDEQFYNNYFLPFVRLLATDLFHSFNSAGWYVSINFPQILDFMDKDNVNKVSKFINNPYGNRVNGIKDREKYRNQIKDFFSFYFQVKPSRPIENKKNIWEQMEILR